MGRADRPGGARAAREPGWVLRLRPCALQSERPSAWLHLPRPPFTGPLPWGRAHAQPYASNSPYEGVEWGSKGGSSYLGSPPRGVFRRNFFRGLDSSSPAPRTGKVGARGRGRSRDGKGLGFPQRSAAECRTGLDTVGRRTRSRWRTAELLKHMSAGEAGGFGRVERAVFVNRAMARRHGQ